MKANEKDSVNEASLFDKIKKNFKAAGKTLIENVLILWYAFPDASPADKAIIIGALAYFISPLDVIPDALPGGYVDDAGVVAAAVARIRLTASPEAIQKAHDKIQEWFED